MTRTVPSVLPQKPSWPFLPGKTQVYFQEDLLSRLPGKSGEREKKRKKERKKGSKRDEKRNNEEKLTEREREPEIKRVRGA